MTKYLLWGTVIAILIVSIIQIKNDQQMEPFTSILFWSILGVLAICESIEKAGKH